MKAFVSVMVGISLMLTRPDPAHAQPGPPRNLPAVFVLDLSKSMEGAKLLALKEAIKLGMTILNGGSARMIRFSDGATIDPLLPLLDHEGRRAAIRYCDALTTYQGTNYLAALDALECLRLPPGTPVIWISDGSPTTGTPDEIAARAGRSGLKFYTIAVQAEADAQGLLSEMSRASRGKSVSVSDGEALATTMIELAFNVSDYLAYAPTESRKEFKGTYGGGSILALGYDATPVVDGAGRGDATLSHTATLPGVHVSVTRVELSSRSNLTYSIGARRTPRGRLAKVLRNDHRRYDVVAITPADGRPAAGGQAEYLAKPAPPALDATGAVIPKRTPALGMEARDVSGRVRSRAVGVPTGDRDGTVVVKLPIPPEPGLALDVFKVETIVDGGAVFKREESVGSLVATLPKTAGLAIERGMVVDLGRRFAGSGRVDIGAVKVPARDDAAGAYRVETDDLGGDLTSIPLTASVSTIRPRASEPSAVGLSAEIGPVPPGVYEGRIRLSSALFPGEQFILARLTIVEPLTAELIGGGRLRPDSIVRSRLRVRNAGPRPVVGAKLLGGPIEVAGGVVELLPPPTLSVPAEGEATIDLNIAVAAGVSERKAIRLPLRVVRGNAEPLTMLVEAKLDDGEPPIRVSPRPLLISGERGAVVAFTIRVRPTADAVVPDRVRASAGDFRADKGQDAAVTFDLAAKPDRLDANRAVEIRGHVVMPTTPGRYAGEIHVLTDVNGRVAIPATIVVR